MALRLIEVIIPLEEVDSLGDFLEDEQTLGFWTDPMDEEFGVTRILTDISSTESITDHITTRFENIPGFRLLLFPIEATIPLPEVPEKESPEKVPGETEKQDSPKRISREELYEDVADGARLTWIFVITVCLSTIVAAIGLMREDVAVVIGAMVIAPLLGPNVALSLASTLGDTKLVVQSIKTLLTGIGFSLVLSVAIGLVFQVDLGMDSLLSRTQVNIGDIVLALAAGSAGALAFTSGIPAGVIGVMVAVALLPPLVIAGLLLGSGNVALAMNATMLVLVNIASINLSGVATFLLQNIRPRNWWEEKKAGKAVRIAVTLWCATLLIVLLIVMFTSGLL